MFITGTDEGFFSRLKLLKSLLRFSISQNHLRKFGINLSIKSEFVQHKELDDVIRTI